jgi:hypothetical protein
MNNFHDWRASHFQQFLLKVFQLSTLYFQLSTVSVESVSTFNSFHDWRASHFQQFLLKLLQLSTLYFQLSTVSVESVSTFNERFTHDKNGVF